MTLLDQLNRLSPEQTQKVALGMLRELPRSMRYEAIEELGRSLIAFDATPTLVREWEDGKARAIRVGDLQGGIVKGFPWGPAAALFVASAFWYVIVRMVIR